LRYLCTSGVFNRDKMAAYISLAEQQIGKPFPPSQKEKMLNANESIFPEIQTDGTSIDGFGQLRIDAVRTHMAAIQELVKLLPNATDKTEAVKAGQLIIKVLKEVEMLVHEAEKVQQDVVEVTYKTKANVSVKIGKDEPTRRGDGTILGDVIFKGVYKPQAGSEGIGYFNPENAPFRNYPNGKTGLLQGPMADQLIVTIPASRGLYGSLLDESGDTAVDLAIKLSLSSTRQVLDTFLQLVKKEAISQFLLVTTTMPFFLTYSIGKVIVLAEVDHELKLNALANMLLKDRSFSSVYSVSAFEAKAISLLDERKQEVEEKKQWAIDLQKSR